MIKKIKRFFIEYNIFVNRMVNTILNKLLTKKVKIFIVRYIKTFKYFIIAILLIAIGVKLMYIYNDNYKRNNIESAFINSKYVGNVIAINKTDFLTTYNTIKNTCVTKNQGKIKYYLLSNNGQRFEVVLKAYDEYKNLAILTSVRRYGDFYVIFNTDLNTEIKIYMSKTNNNLDYKFYSYNVKNNDGVDFIKTLDFPREYYGESLINDNFEVIGLATYEKSGFLSKYVYITNSSVVKQFLKENNIIHASNYTNTNLRLINNYLNNINYKLVCREEMERSPLIFERRR